MIKVLLRLTFRVGFQLLLAVLTHLPVETHARGALVPQIIVAVVGSDSAEPRAKRRLKVITANRPKRFDENLLGEVLHLIPPAHQMVNLREYTLLVFLHQGSESLGIPLLGALNPRNLLARLGAGGLHWASIVPTLIDSDEGAVVRVTVTNPAN